VQSAPSPQCAAALKQQAGPIVFGQTVRQSPSFDMASRKQTNALSTTKPNGPALIRHNPLGNGSTDSVCWHGKHWMTAPQFSVILQVDFD